MEKTLSEAMHTTTLFHVLIFFLSTLLNPTSHAYPINENCPSYCLCDAYMGNLTVFCTQPQLTDTFVLPPPRKFSITGDTRSLLLNHAYLRSFPLNLCQYQETVQYLDLSSNFIAAPVTGYTFNCLRELLVLNLSNNLVQKIDSSSFDFLNNLRMLDLRNNRLTVLSVDLFYFKLPSLSTLILRNNLLIDIDIWFLFMPAVTIVDISFNQLRRFVNAKQWSPYLTTAMTRPRATPMLVDLRFNQLTTFDDEVLKLYSVCDQSSFNQFIGLFGHLLLENNPLSCSCSASYNLLTFYAAYAANPYNNQVFMARCVSEQYAGRSIFAFDSPSSCAPSGQLFADANCGYKQSLFQVKSPAFNPDATSNSTTSTTSTKPTTQSSLIKKLQVKNVSIFAVVTTVHAVKVNIKKEVLDGSIMGGGNGSVVVSQSMTERVTEAASRLWATAVAAVSMVACVLTLMCLCCACRVEGIALLFTAFPWLRRLCARRERQVKREKLHDLFISFNRSDEQWVKNQLVPNIKKNALVDNYILHYNENQDSSAEPYSLRVKHALNNCSSLLLIASNQYMKHEWANEALRDHLHKLVTHDSIRLLWLTLSETRVDPKEVKRHFAQDVTRKQRVALLRLDETLFWPKLAYHLYMRPDRAMAGGKVKRVHPTYTSSSTVLDGCTAKKRSEELRSSSLLKSSSFSIGRPLQESKLTLAPVNLLTYANEREIESSTLWSAGCKQTDLRNKFLLDEADNGKDQFKGRINQSLGCNFETSIILKEKTTKK